MTRVCSEHGEQVGMVERDPLFYTYVCGLPKQGIYAGTLTDVTSTCNLRCNYCYFPLKKKDEAGEYSSNRIIQECLVNRHNAPFILVGGEPTMHHDAVELFTHI